MWAKGHVNTTHEVGTGRGKLGGGSLVALALNVRNWACGSFSSVIGKLVVVSAFDRLTTGREIRNQIQVSNPGVSFPVSMFTDIAGLNILTIIKTL